MRFSFVSALMLGFSAAVCSGNDLASRRFDSWHQWRGPLASGVAPHGDPPLRWDESTNIKWKIAIPGSGSATPIIWGDRVYLVTVVDTGRKPPGAEVAQQEEASQRPGGRRRFSMSTPKPTTFHQFTVLCLDRSTGRTIWQRVANELVPFAGHHPTNGYASASPTTNGQHLYASFGSYGIYCFDMDGNPKWNVDLGDMRTRVGFGEGTSPVLHDDSLIVNWDHEGDSFITCLNAVTGDEKWRTPRDEQTSWATPLVVQRAGTPQIVTNAQKRTRSYDLATGKLIWECGGQASNPIPSPVTGNGVVYCMTGFRGYAVYALPLAARGDISDSNKIVWNRTDNGPYVASPVLYDDLLYLTKGRNGILSCFRASTGEVQYSEQRLPGIRTIYASLAAAGGKVYVVGRGGTTVVIKHGPKYEVLATNKLDEGIDASPVIVGRQMFLRGQKHLYCIASD